MIFSFHLLNFDKNQPVFDKNRPELATPVFGKTGRFISETGRISVFSVFTVPPSSSVRFDRIFLIFVDFCRIFLKTDGIGTGFPCSAEFSNSSATPILTLK
jgi:hypothetical protein